MRPVKEGRAWRQKYVVQLQAWFLAFAVERQHCNQADENSETMIREGNYWWFRL